MASRFRSPRSAGVCTCALLASCNPQPSSPMAPAGPSAASSSPPAGASPPDATAPGSVLLGLWEVVGCESDPIGHQADCARGEVIFEDWRVSVRVPACTLSRQYRVVSEEPGKVRIRSEGISSEIVLDAQGRAQWSSPGCGDPKIVTLSFIRHPGP